MKRVVATITDNTLLDNVTSNKYYGFIIGGNSPGYIATDCALYNKDSYSARFFHGLTEGNKYLKPDSPTLKECIARLLVGANHAVIYEFDSSKELFEWAVTVS